jgi:TRAP-type mannitol/chloroaromatic compound transport system permease small subunit
MALAVRAIGALNTALGRVFAWFALGVVLVCFAVVALRYLFSIGFIWMQDLYVWLNGMMFTGIAAYALLRGQHVRVDIFYRPATPRTKAWIDLLGCLLLLLPFVAVILLWSWNFVARSWQFSESSGNVGGLPGLYVLKSFIILFAITLGLQGIAMALRAILVLANRADLLPPDPAEDAPAEA